MSFKIADTSTHRILFFSIWLLFALIQSALMPLSGEEAYDFDILSYRREPVKLLLYSLKGERVLAERVLLSDLNTISNGELIKNFEVVLPEIQSDTQLRFSVSSGNLPSTIKSERIKSLI